MAETTGEGFDPDEVLGNATPGATEPAGITVLWNLMYRGKGGHDEHLSFKASGADSSAALAALNREGIIATLESSGATAKFAAAPTPMPVAQQPGQVVMRPGVVQAPVAQGPQRLCPNNHVMKLIPAGISKTTQKAYPAFYVCEAGCMNPNGRKYSENQ